MMIFLSGCGKKHNFEVCNLSEFDVSKRILLDTYKFPFQLSKASISPSENFIAVSSREPFSFTIFKQGSKAREPLFTMQIDGFVEEFIWDNAGRNLAILPTGDELYIYNSNNNELKVYVSDSGPIGRFNWSENGSSFLISYLSETSANLFDLIETDSFSKLASYKRPEKFTKGVSQMAWSANDINGMVVFFSLNRLFQYDLKNELLSEVSVDVLDTGNNDVEWMGKDSFLVIANKVYDLDFYQLKNGELQHLCKLPKESTGISFDSGKLINDKTVYAFYIRSEAIYLFDLESLQFKKLMNIDFTNQNRAYIFDIDVKANILIIVNREENKIDSYRLLN